jgi:hypothetical protein
MKETARMGRSLLSPAVGAVKLTYTVILRAGMKQPVEAEIGSRARVVRSESLLAISDFVATNSGENGDIPLIICRFVGIARPITPIAVRLRGNERSANNSARNAQADTHATKTATSIASAPVCSLRSGQIYTDSPSGLSFNHPTHDPFAPGVEIMPSADIPVNFQSKSSIGVENENVIPANAHVCGDVIGGRGKRFRRPWME